MTINFTKMHGIGNDYILIDSRDMERDWSKLAIAMCDRHFGIGADGILLVQPSDVADYRLRIYNPDGSEAEACGNGIRMFAKYLVERGLTPPDTSEIRIQTLGAVGTVQVRSENGRINSVRASMGVPRLKPSEIPVALKENIDTVKAHPLRVDGRELALTCISLGNPHAVLFIGEPVDR